MRKDVILALITIIICVSLDTYISYGHFNIMGTMPEFWYWLSIGVATISIATGGSYIWNKDPRDRQYSLFFFGLYSLYFMFRAINLILYAF